MEAAPGSAANTRRLPPVSASVGVARDFVRDHLDAMALDAALVTDIQLAVSELVTNGVVHGNGGAITLEIASAPDQITCLVVSPLHGRPLPDPALWMSPVGGGPTGRGLAIVREVADEVAVESDGDLVEVKCTFRRR